VEIILRTRDVVPVYFFVFVICIEMLVFPGGFGGAFQSMFPVRLPVVVLAGGKLLKFQLTRRRWTERPAIHIANRDHYDRNRPDAERHGKRNRHLEPDKRLRERHARGNIEPGNSNHSHLRCAHSSVFAAALPQ
jgi:hypothetical protein